MDELEISALHLLWLITLYSNLYASSSLVENQWGWSQVSQCPNVSPRIQITIKFHSVKWWNLINFWRRIWWRVANSNTNQAMVLDSLVASPHRRTSSFKRHRDELGSWSVLLERHRFLLTTLVLLLFLCTIYLYFAVTLGEKYSCSRMIGAEKALCESKSSSFHNGKLKFFWQDLKD